MNLLKFANTFKNIHLQIDIIQKFESNLFSIKSASSLTITNAHFTLRAGVFSSCPFQQH